jgi:hypothetical protein
MPRTLAAPMVIAALVAFVPARRGSPRCPFPGEQLPVFGGTQAAEATVTASGQINASTFEGPNTLGSRFTWATLIEINYRTPIDVNDTADIEASLRQEEAGAGVKHHELESTDWPITLRLDGPGLDWTEHDIPIKEGTPLPVTEHWVPRAKAAGEYVMRFRLRDINHAVESHGFHIVSDTVKVTVNGVYRDAHGSDDMTLPIAIWTHGIPARWFDRLTFFGTAISGLAALMVGVFGSGWGTALVKAMRRRTSHS